MSERPGQQLSIESMFDVTPVVGEPSKVDVETEKSSPVAESTGALTVETPAVSEKYSRSVEVPDSPPGKYKSDAPMLRQYLATKEKYPQHLLLFQVGDFYEVFYEDSQTVSAVLNIRLTSRNKDQENPVPMCGVPIHALENYLPKLITAGHSVVVVSQCEDAQKGKMVRREISRIVTPGIRYEGDGLDERRYNYLAAACVGNSGAGSISYVDVSTGHLHIQECESAAELQEIVERTHPSELLIPSALFGVAVSKGGWVRDVRAWAQQSGCRIVTRAFERLTRNDVVARVAGASCADVVADDEYAALSLEGLSSIDAILNYVDEVSFGRSAQLSHVSVEAEGNHVVIDSATRRNLELTETRIDNDRKNSLLGHIDYTKTAMGARLLSACVLSPSTDETVINGRLDAVEEFVAQTEALETIRRALIGVRDIDRIVTRMTSGQANPRDLRMLGDSLEELPTVKETLSTFSSSVLQAANLRFDVLEDVCEKLTSALIEEPPIKLSEGGIFREGFHEEVDSFRSIRTDGKSLLAELEAKEKAATGITALKIKYNNVFGYFIEVTKAHLSKIPDHYERKQTLVNAERFVTKELKTFEVKILSARGRQVELERELFKKLRLEISAQAARIQGVARVLSELDVLGNFAHLAIRHDFVRPTMTNDRRTEIRGGRHPVVERVIGAHNFVANDTLLEDGRMFAVITGPNMGGKSTYLRQVGLTQLLAQSGSFVPAESATLGIVDRIFTRIGAADDLSRGDSTFMVEMREAGVILRKASSKSLVLIDEIGRGTATTDGLAIATAIAEWLHREIGCRTIFATHFHELAALAEETDGMFCLAVGVIERDKEITFTHRIEEKVADRSYGIEVARLAGLPERMLQRAEQILATLDDSALESLPLASQVVCDNNVAEHSVSGALADGIRACDVDGMTPIAALNELTRLKQILED